MVVLSSQAVTINQTTGNTAPNQVNLSVTFAQSTPVAFSGTLSLSFKPDPSVTNVPAGYYDPSAGFPISGQSGTALTYNFTVPQGAIQASTPFAEGTVAGTWTVTLTSLTTMGGSVLPNPSPFANCSCRGDRAGDYTGKRADHERYIQRLCRAD
jgi:hypothetical protein